MIPKKNALEWSVFAVSLALIIAAVAVLLLHASRDADSPPQFVIRIGETTREGAGYRVPVMIQNRGDETAAEVKVEVALRDGKEINERADFTLAFLPRHATREGAVVFARDPRCCEIVARAVGYEKP